MKFQGALIKEQGITFAIVIVKSHVFTSHDREDVRHSFGTAFPGVPIVLMAQDSRGTPSYHGRKDIVNFLASVPMQAIPWKEYTIS